MESKRIFLTDPQKQFLKKSLGTLGRICEGTFADFFEVKTYFWKKTPMEKLLKKSKEIPKILKQISFFKKLFLKRSPLLYTCEYLRKYFWINRWKNIWINLGVILEGIPGGNFVELYGETSRETVGLVESCEERFIKERWWNCWKRLLRIF